MCDAVETRRRFHRIGAAGIFFQGGAAAIDHSTVVAALVHGLTGSLVAVGAAAAIARAGWLVPQLFVGYVAQSSSRRMPFYVAGAFGRAVCLAVLAALLWLGAALPMAALVTSFFVLWTMYAFIGGIVAVPYNDIVARSVPSERRSRLLAIRFFGGGVLALAVAAAAHGLLDTFAFPHGYAAILLLGALLLLISALLFVSAGEPPLASSAAPPRQGFGAFLRAGLDAVRDDRRFRLFVSAQWFGAAAAMALPFYILEAQMHSGSTALTASFLAAQTGGALLSNPLWGWWGDRHGKLSLLNAVTWVGLVPPLLALAWMALNPTASGMLGWTWFAAVFAILGAAGNGATIAQLGYLMEISPDERRPAYSGYFNAIIAPATLLPLLGALLARVSSLAALFAVSAAAVALQVLLVRALRMPHRSGAARI
ncbi:MAG: MFS transporter [Betaproteobacteria bacterium]|nr:MFS transporter [Betaproteobacteria bacterium]